MVWGVVTSATASSCPSASPSSGKKHVQNISESSCLQCVHLTNSECKHCYFQETYSLNKETHPSAFWTDLAVSSAQVRRQTVKQNTN